MVEQPHDRRWWTLAVLCLSMFLVVMSNGSLFIAVPSLSRELHASQSALQWILDSYALVFSGLLFVCGSIGDRYGRKGTLQVGLVVFALASLGGVLAHSAAQLIAVRSAMGVGAALIMPSTLSIVANLFEGPERATAIGVWAGMAGIGGVAGPVFSGLLLSNFWWGSIFIAGVVMAMFTFAMGYFFIPTSRDPHARRLDPVGAVLSSLGLGTFLFAVIEAPDRGWSDRVTISALAVSAMVIAVFAWWELRRPTPMLELRLFRITPFTVGAMTLTITYLMIFGFQFLSVQYLQSVKGFSPLRGGLGVIPVSITISLLAPRTGRLALRYGGSRVVVAGLLVMATALLSFTVVVPNTPYLYFAVFLVVFGAGIALIVAPSTTAIMSSVPREQAGMGSAMNDATREVGTALGIAVVGTLHALVYRSQLRTDLRTLSDDAAAKARSAISGAHRVGSDLGGDAGRALSTHADHAFTSALRVVDIALACAALAMAIMNWRYRTRPDSDGPA